MIALFDTYAGCLFLFAALSVAALLGWTLHMAQTARDSDDNRAALGKAALEYEARRRRGASRW